MGLPCVCGEPHVGISTTLLESTEEVVDAKTSVEESPLAAQGTSLLAQCRSSSHMSCCDIGVPRDCIQRYMLRDVRWFELCAGKGDLHFPGWPHGSLDWFRDYGVGFFTTSLTSYIERLRSSTLTEQSISEDVSLSMPGRACQDVGVTLGESFPDVSWLSQPGL